MELTQRYAQLTQAIDQMNAEAVHSMDIPYIRLHDYVHFCDVKAFLYAYTHPLRLRAEDFNDLLEFCCRDTLEIKSRWGECDLYALTFHYFKMMVVRTGNLDTPDDCVEKLDLDRFGPYRAAREKQWRGEKPAQAEEELMEKTERAAVAALRIRRP